MKNYKAIIYDIDGTLLNTLTTIKHYVNETISELGLSPISTDECRSFIGHGAHHLIDCTLKSKGVSDNELLVRTLNTYNAKYDANTLYLTQPYDGILEMVDELVALGIRLAVLSNKPDPTTTDLVARFFPGRFSVVHGGRPGVPLKPDPTALLDTIRELGLSQDEIMYVGDTGVDVLTGKNAGVYKTVGVSWGYRPVSELRECSADVILNTPSEIVREVKENA